MALTIDANVLIYAQDESSSMHEPARSLLEGELLSGEPAFLFLPVVVAFFRVSTQPGLFRRPLLPEQAYENIAELLALPHVSLGLPVDNFLEEFRSIVTKIPARGRLVHDAEIVALMRQHGVERIVTADRDFHRFDGIKVTLLSP